MAHTIETEIDHNLVEMWTRKDPVAWTAGIMGGLVAGVVAAAVGGLIAKRHGLEFLFPVKFAGLPILGNSATAYTSSAGLIVGGVCFFGLAAFLGFLYSHFANPKAFVARLGMGFVWGTFSWIFIGNLYMQSWFDVRAVNMPNSATFFVTLAYGLSLISVGMFDSIIRGSKSA